MHEQQHSFFLLQMSCHNGWTINEGTRNKKCWPDRWSNPQNWDSRQMLYPLSCRGTIFFAPWNLNCFPSRGVRGKTPKVERNAHGCKFHQKWTNVDFVRLYNLLAQRATNFSPDLWFIFINGWPKISVEVFHRFLIKKISPIIICDHDVKWRSDTTETIL